MQVQFLKFWRTPFGVVYLDRMGSIAETLDFKEGYIQINNGIFMQLKLERSDAWKVLQMQLKQDGGKLQYCGRFVGEEALPGSDGQCGPDDGPQCADCRQQQQQQQQQGGGGGAATLAGELEKLVKLRDSGALTQEEFETSKRSVMNKFE